MVTGAVSEGLEQLWMLQIVAVEHMIYAIEDCCRGEPVQSLNFDSRRIERIGVPVVHRQTLAALLGSVIVIWLQPCVSGGHFQLTIVATKITEDNYEDLWWL